MSDTWIRYADQKPTEAGVYQWRVPSVAVKGLTVTFYAHMQERGAGHETVLSPTFDHWTGWTVVVPKDTEWRMVDNPPDIPKHEYAGLQPEGVSLLPCPFCGKIPVWEGHQSWLTGGVTIGARPHEYNEWAVTCCGWAQKRRFRDPRELAKVRNELLTAHRREEG